MNEVVKKFLRENINLIDEENWKKLYLTAKAAFSYAEYMGIMTDFLLDCGCGVFEGEHRLEVIPTGFLAGTSRKEFVIPEHITEIGFAAFSNSKLEKITIPKTVKQIIRLAFSNCENLEEVKIETTKLPPRSTVSAFTDCPRIRTVTFDGDKATWRAMQMGIELRTETTVVCNDGIIQYDYMGDEV